LKHAVADLVNVILARIEEHREGTPSEVGLRQWLSGQGYKKRDIDAALKLVRPHFVTPVPVYGNRTPGRVRQLSEYEARKLAPEARDALVRLDLFELISPIEREMLLDRIIQYEGEITLDELDYLLSWAIYSVRDVESQQTVYNVVEGLRESLH
jgi:uncharacterized protein Smg (DUF494 family)